MGKKEAKSNIYEVDQANKKHRKKNKKLEKRETHKKNKKKNKKEKHEKRKLYKYVQKAMKENSHVVDFSRIPVDMEEVERLIRKIISINAKSIEEIPNLFKMMEENKKEIDLSRLEDKSVQKYLVKLMKHLRLNQNVKNPFAFRIPNTRVKEAHAKYTTNPEELMPECLSSYYHFTKAMFEYLNFALHNNSEDNKDDNEDLSVNEDLQESDEEQNEKSKTKKELDKEKYAMDYEYELIEEKVGKNAEFINRAFHKILNETNPKTVAENDPKEDKEEELVGPSVPNFLESTMSLLEDNDSLDNVINTHTYRKSKPNEIKSTSKLDPINKDSYDRLVEYERKRMLSMQNEIESYNEKYRSTSLLEQHQMKNKKGSIKDEIKPFDRERDMNIGRVDSKRALKIMQEAKGLEGRFVSKEKYLGF